MQGGGGKGAADRLLFSPRQVRTRAKGHRTEGGEVGRVRSRRRHSNGYTLAGFVLIYRHLSVGGKSVQSHLIGGELAPAAWNPDFSGFSKVSLDSNFVS